MGNKSNKKKKIEEQIKNTENIEYAEKIKYNEIIEQYNSNLNHKDKACITSFSILRNNRIMLTFKEGKVKIFKLFTINDNIELKEIIIMELDEYCFNYGIELKNGNIALCSEDSTLNIIKLSYNDDNKQNEENDINQIQDKKNYSIIQKIDLKDEPFYIIKELSKGELIIGGWNHLLIFAILPYSDKYELINKLFIKDRTFSLIELSVGEIIPSQCYSKTLTIYNIYECETKIINNIESNENPNIICKYNEKNEIVLVAHDKGINIVSITDKCLIKNIKLKDIASSLCPLNIFIYTKKGKDDKEIFTLLVGTKKRVFGRNVNYIYNIMHIGFNFLSKNNKGEIIYSTETKEKIENKAYFISQKEAVHFNEIKQINVIKRNIIFNDKDNDNNKDEVQKKENKIIISMGSEDKRLIFWEMNNLAKKK